MSGVFSPEYEREATLRIQDDRRELKAQAELRFEAVRRGLRLADDLLRAVADLHAPTFTAHDPGIYVGCTGCDRDQDFHTEPEWPCRTFALIERGVLGP